jgi:hypothetical protein
MSKPYPTVIGLKVNKLTAIANDPDRRHNVVLRCDCGNEFSTRRDYFVNGKVNSCNKGDCNISRKSLVGKRFSKLTVIKDIYRPNKDAKLLVICDCNPNKEWEKVRSDVVKGNTTSCGHCDDPVNGVIPPHAMPAVILAVKNKIYRNYIMVAARRKKVWRLPKTVFHQLVSGDCHYCGFPPATPKKIERVRCEKTVVYLNGVDRKDNTIGYTIDNSVSCCKTCNFAKRNMTYAEFSAYLDRVAKHRCKCCAHYEAD